MSKKKIFALLVAFTMIFSLCSCKANTGKKFFEELDSAQSFKTGSFSTSIDIETEMSDEDLLEIGNTFGIYPEDNHVNITFSFEGKVDSDKNIFDTNIYLAFEDEERTLLTNVVGSENIYVNVSQLIDSLINIKAVKDAVVEQTSEEVFNGLVGFVKGMFEGKEYVVLEASDADVKSFNFNTYLTTLKDSDLYKGLRGLIQETVLGFEPSVITKEKNVYTLTLTGENFKVINEKVQAYVKENAEQVYTLLHDIAVINDNQMAESIYSMIDSTFYNEFNEYPYDNDEAIKIIESNKDNIVEGIKNYSPTKTEEEFKGTICVSIDNSNSENKTSVTIDDGSTKVSFKTATKSEAVEITIPENTISFKEIKASIGDSFGMGDIGGDFELDPEFSFGETEQTNPATISDDGWRRDEDILMSSIDDEEMASAIDKWRSQLTKSGYKDFLVNYSYGSYELSCVNEEGLKLEVEFDPNFGSEENDKIFNISFSLEGNRKNLEKDYFLDRLDVEIFKVLNKRLPKAEMLKAFENEDNVLGDLVTGYVYGDGESYYGTWTAASEKDAGLPHMEMTVAFD